MALRAANLLVKQRKVGAHAKERNDQVLDRAAAAESLPNSLPQNKYHEETTTKTSERNELKTIKNKLYDSDNRAWLKEMPVKYDRIGSVKSLIMVPKLQKMHEHEAG